MVSRRPLPGTKGDLPLNLDEWYSAKDVTRQGGLKFVETKPQDTLGPTAKKPPKEYREPQKRMHGGPKSASQMCRPTSFVDKPEGLRVIAQRDRWADPPRPEGTRKFAPREFVMAAPDGLKVIRDEAGERFAEKRSQVMSFKDLTGSKRRISEESGMKDPRSENADAWPGMKGRAPDYVDGKYVDYTLKHNGGFLGTKVLKNVTLSSNDSSTSRYFSTFNKAAGATSTGEGAASHGWKGKSRQQTVASILAWEG